MHASDPRTFHMQIALDLIFITPGITLFSYSESRCTIYGNLTVADDVGQSNSEWMIINDVLVLNLISIRHNHFI
jgi:hypothetical protein